MKNKVLKSTTASVILLFALVTSFSFISLTKNCFSAAMVFIVDEGILTKFETGTISAVFYMVYAVFQMASGPVIDRWKPDKLITIGLVGAGVSNLVVFLNQNYAVMIAAWVFNAIAQCAVWPSVFKIASTVVCRSMRGKSLFFINICGALGSIFSFIVAAIVSTRWHLNFLFSSIGLFVVALLWELCLFLLKPHFSDAEDVGFLQNSEITETKSDAPKFLKILFSYGILLLFVIAIFRSAFDLGLKALAPTIINESYEAVTPVLSTLLSIIVIVAGVFGTFVASMIYPKFVKNEALAVFLLFCLAFPFVILLLLIGRAHYFYIIIFLAMTVFILNTASMFTSSYIGGRFNRWNKGGTVVAFVNGGAALGIVVANMVFTSIADSNGWLFTIKVWIALMAIGIVLCAVFLYIWTKFLKKR